MNSIAWISDISYRRAVKQLLNTEHTFFSICNKLFGYEAVLRKF